MSDEDGIMFHPAKTVNSSAVRMLITMTPELKAIGPVICTQAGGRFTYSGAQTAWKRACQRARQRYESGARKRRSSPISDI